MVEPATYRHFNTAGHTVYHLAAASVDDTTHRCIVGAAYDGIVLCHRMDGTLLWSAETGGYFPFDLSVADVDGDGFDEVFVAGADGILYAFDHDGAPIWQFAGAAPMLAVCALKMPDGRAHILAGGIDQNLYFLSPRGELRQAIRTRGVVRFLCAGRFLAADKVSIAASIHLACRATRDNIYLNIFDPDNAAPVHADDYLIPFENIYTRDHDLALSTAIRQQPKIFSMIAADINHDGMDEILISLGNEEPGRLFAFTGNFQSLPWKFKPVRKFQWDYRMNILSHVTLPARNDEFILGLYGYEAVVYNLDGTCRQMIKAPYAFADGIYDPISGYYIFGSSTCGGDDIHLLRLDDPDWPGIFETLPATGKLAQIKSNVAQLKAAAINAPRQTPPNPVRPCVITNLSPEEIRALSKEIDCRNVDIASFHILTENIPEGWHRDGRMPFDLTREQIVGFAREKEAAGDLFALWAGHGGSFYMTLETLEEVLKAAPTTLRALIFAEMWPGRNQMLPRVADLIETKMRPLAELCLKHGQARMVLRNQRLFWNAVCYTEPWRDFLFDSRYREILVPSMEETHCRTQDISLSGRVGLWLSGTFAHHAGRAVMDNATFSRLWEWSSQRLTHHHFRAMALHAVLGADMFLVNLRDGMFEEFSVFMAMLDRGLLSIPRREDLLSVSEVCLGMRRPSESFYEHADNAHTPIDFQGEGETAAFDRLDWHWGGAPIREDDFSRYGFGSRMRMLNYLPRMPHGFVASVPDDAELAATASLKRKISTNGEFFYDEHGARRTAKEYRPVVENFLRESAERLPVRVEGNVAWSAMRLEPGKIRITLIDCGYLDPADREAVIILQQMKALRAQNVTANAELPVNDGRIQVTVPMAVLTVVDVAHAAD